MAELTALQSVPGGQIGSGNAQVFNPMPGVQILKGARERQDQLDWHNKQAEMARQKAALDARKRAEEEEVVAKYEEGKGELFARPIQNLLDQRIAENAKRWPAMNKAQKLQTIAGTDRLAAAANVFSASQDAGVKELRTRLGSEYNIPATLIKQMVDEKVRKDPEFYKKDIIPEIEQAITSNPEFFNWDAVGSRLVKNREPISVKNTNTSGIKKDEKFSDFLQTRKNSKTGRVEVVLDPETGLPLVDNKVALGIIESDPIAKNMKDRFIAMQLPILQQKFPNVTNDQLLSIAQGEVINKMLRGRAVYDVEKDLESTKKEAQSRAQGAKMGGYQEYEGPVNVNYRTTYSDGTQTITPINLGVGRSIKPDKPVKVNSNKRAYLLGGDIEALGDLATPMPDGSIILNFGFDVNEFQEVKDVLQLTQDTKFNDNGVMRVRPKGSLISPSEAKNMQKLGLDNNFKKVSGYRISPNSLRVDEETEKKIGPAYRGIDIFVPNDLGELPELENAKPYKRTPAMGAEKPRLPGFK